MNELPNIAQNLASRGRNGDTMLMHVTPEEVRGLQAIAEQHGTSLTINPDTGLPEAFSLRKLLPMLAGAALTATGIGAPMAALMVGGGTTMATGNLEQGLMAGLGAYGGASLAGAFNAPAAAAGAPVATTPGAAPFAGTPITSGAVTPGLNSSLGTQGFAGSTLPSGAAVATTPGAAPFAGTPITSVTPPSIDTALSTQGFGSAATLPSASPPPFMNRFAQAAAGPGGTPAMYKTALAGTGLMTPLTPEPYKVPDAEDPYARYKGPHTPTSREVRYPTEDEMRRRRTSEFTYFSPSNPVPFQKGGAPMLEDGGFVLTKKAVDGLGKGDNRTGQQVASRGLGAIPIKGPGHGTSDSIRTSIEGKQPALVSNGEAYVPKKQVQKNGGAKKFYALMKAAERRA